MDLVGRLHLVVFYYFVKGGRCPLVFTGGKWPFYLIWANLALAWWDFPNSLREFFSWENSGRGTGAQIWGWTKLWVGEINFSPKLGGGKKAFKAGEKVALGISARGQRFRNGNFGDHWGMAGEKYWGHKV